jgi:DNA invertase Pin-like site-specific DNA recombinase
VIARTVPQFLQHEVVVMAEQEADMSVTFQPRKAVSDKGCSFRSLGEPWADTSTAAGRLMLTVLGGLAEYERELIKSRTSEGRERAKRAGVRMGRKPILSPHQIVEVRDRKANGESVRLLARSYGQISAHYHFSWDQDVN